MKSAMRHATRATKYAEELSAEKDRVQALNKEVQELQRSTEAMRGKLLEHTEENARAVEARNRRLLDLDSRMQSTKFVKVANVESFNDKGSILQQKAKPSRESLSTIPGKISETKTSHAGKKPLLHRLDPSLARQQHKLPLQAQSYSILRSMEKQVMMFLPLPGWKQWRRWAQWVVWASYFPTNRTRQRVQTWSTGLNPDSAKNRRVSADCNVMCIPQDTIHKDKQINAGI